MNSFQITFFDVGEGDSIAMKWETQDGPQYGIIDCCMKPDQNEPPVLEWLRDKELKELAFLCLTHYHYDHYRGLPSVLQYCSENGVEINRLWVSGVVRPVELHHRLVEKLDELEELDQSAKEDMGITQEEVAVRRGGANELREILNWKAQWPDSETLWRLHGVHRGRYTSEPLRFDCLAPTSAAEEAIIDGLVEFAFSTPRKVSEARSAENPVSVVVGVAVDTAYVLLGGDAGKDEWRTALGEAVASEQFDQDELRAHLVKASHHGSRHSSAEDIWLRVLQEEAAVVISASTEGNSYGHPHMDTLDDLWTINHEQYPIRLFCTNAPPICRALLNRAARGDAHWVRRRYGLLSVFPGHQVRHMGAAQQAGGFGTMTFRITGSDSPSAELIRSDRRPPDCLYLANEVRPGAMLPPT